MEAAPKLAARSPLLFDILLKSNLGPHQPDTPCTRVACP